MRRPRFVLTSALAAVGFTALAAQAQQSPRPTYPPGASSAASDPTFDPGAPQRPARYLLRNGFDYLNYREYDRALNFFRATEKRQAELSDQEKAQLRQGIARAQQGKREAVNGPHVVAQPKGRPTNPPGSFALAAPAPVKPAVARRAMAPEPVQLTSGTVEAAAAADPAAPAMESAVPAPRPAAPAGVIPSDPASLDLPPVAAAAPRAADGMELPSLPAAPPEPLPDLASTPPAASAVALPVAPEPPAAGGEMAPLPTLPGLPAAPAGEPAAPGELPTLGSTAATAPAGADPAPFPTLPTAPPEAPAAESPAPPPTQDPAPSPTPPPPDPAPEPAQDPAAIPAQARGIEPPPAPDASTVTARSATSPVGVDLDRSTAPRLEPGELNGSFLSAHDQEYVARLAQRVGESPAGERANAASPVGETSPGSGPPQGSTRLELQRAPSPTEARPIRSIPVPEEFVSLTARDWSPNRKFWAAAGTCHMTLYFQDPVLERYGQGVEQALGTRGRYFSYPLDDPKQSNQRNQILQPFYSIGKFCFQVGTLPYKLVVDPPWEAEYDLGYYRPGDKIPQDTIVITPTGVGPPLKGRRY